MKPGRLCAWYRFVLRNMFRYPATHSLLKAWFACVVEASLHFCSVIKTHCNNMTLKKIIYLRCCKLGPSSQKYINKSALHMYCFL